MTTAILMPQAVRSGSFFSPSALVAASQAGKFYITASMLPADMSSSSNSMALTIQYSTNSGLTYQDYCGCIWTGGASNMFKTGWAVSQLAAPGVGSNIEPLAGQRLRALINLPVGVTTGFVITTTP